MYQYLYTLRARDSLGGVGAHSTDKQVLQVIRIKLLSLVEYARKQIKKVDKNSVS